MSGTKVQKEKEKQPKNINLGSGQQCVRDFFICLHKNAQHWIDVYEFLSIHTVDSTMCLQCEHRNEINLRQIYIEMEVPPEGSTLGQLVEEQFNESYLVDYFCEVCKKQSQAEKRLVLNSIEDTAYVIVLLRRNIQGEDGNMIVKNKISAVDEIRLM